MKETVKERRTISHDTYKATLCHNKKPALCVHTVIFQFKGRSLARAARRINAHYRYLARRLKRRSQGVLLRRAAKDSKNGDAFIPHTLTVRHKVTYHANELLSLYHDLEQNDGQARDAVCRMADTWRLCDGTVVTLKDFCKTPKLLRLAVAEAGRRAEAGQTPWFVRYAKLMRRYFDKSRFYLTEHGVALFWEAGVIAPASHGVQTVVVPYGDLGIKMPPL